MSKRYIACNEEGYFIDTTGVILDDFALDWDEYYEASQNPDKQIEVSFNGDETKNIFYSLEDARSLCERFGKSLMLESGNFDDITFNILEVGNVFTEKRTRKGNVVKEQKYFEFVKYVEDVYVEDYADDSLTDLEREVYENCCGDGQGEVARAKKITAWLKDRFGIGS